MKKKASEPRVTIEHRFGGHGGIPTEWEIKSSDEKIKALIRSLPVLWPVQHSTDEHAEYHKNWIDLPQGTQGYLAKQIAQKLRDLDKEGLLRVLRKVRDGQRVKERA